MTRSGELIAVTAIVLGPLAAAIAQEAGKQAPAPGAEARGDEGAAPRKAEDRAGGKKAAPGISESGPLTARDKTALIGRMRRQSQAGNIPLLRQTVKLAFDRADPKRDRDLLAHAAFHRAGLCGFDEDEKGCWEWIEKAIGYEYNNSDSFESSRLIPDTIKSSDRFRERMEKLHKLEEAMVWEDFQTQVRARQARRLEGAPLTLPTGEPAGGAPFVPEAFHGRPAYLMVTPWGHDGFTKMAPSIAAVKKQYADKLAFGLLLVQYDLKDAAQIERARAYVKQLGLDLPSLVVGRDSVRPLEIPYYPAHLFLNSQGRVSDQRLGFLDERQLGFILAEMVKKAPATAPPPLPAPKPEEKPAPKPEEPAASKPEPRPEERPAPKAEGKPSPAKEPAKDGEKPAPKSEAKPAPPPEAPRGEPKA